MIEDDNINKDFLEKDFDGEKDLPEEPGSDDMAGESAEDSLLEEREDADIEEAEKPVPAYRVPGASDKKHQLSGMFRNWYLEYASYVILERAVPHIEDGLKPVQRRILHTMQTLDDGRFNKVANIVGSTMSYHPHGDASIGDALVQLGQKELLIDTQGNWGNILTGDSAAAPRYIEARLSEFALETLFSPQDHRVAAELRRTQKGTRDTSGEVPAAACAGSGRYRRGSQQQDTPPQLQRNR